MLEAIEKGKKAERKSQCTMLRVIDKHDKFMGTSLTLKPLCPRLDMPPPGK